MHSYRLGLMCRWRDVLFQMALLCFWCKEVLLWPSNKKFSIFALDPIRPYLDWALRIFDLLTHLRPFQIWHEMKTKVQNWTKMSICHRTVNHKKIWNVPLDALICPLQIINDIEAISLTLHGVNACFIHHLSNVENYSIGHKSETGQPKKKKKKCVKFTYLYTFLQILGSKFKIPSATEIVSTFRHQGSRHLMAQQMAHRCHTQKSKIG